MFSLGTNRTSLIANESTVCSPAFKEEIQTIQLQLNKGHVVSVESRLCVRVEHEETNWGWLGCCEGWRGIGGVVGKLDSDITPSMV